MTRGEEEREWEGGREGGRKEREKGRAFPGPQPPSLDMEEFASSFQCSGARSPGSASREGALRGNTLAPLTSGPSAAATRASKADIVRERKGWAPQGGGDRRWVGGTRLQNRDCPGPRVGMTPQGVSVSGAGVWQPEEGGVKRGGQRAQCTSRRGVRPEPGLDHGTQRPAVGARDGG